MLFQVTRGKNGYADTVAGMKKSRIQSNGNENFHLLLYPQKHPALPSMLFQLTHNKQQPLDQPPENR